MNGEGEHKKGEGENSSRRLKLERLISSDSLSWSTTPYTLVDIREIK